jgi:hypothetical protein
MRFFLAFDIHLCNPDYGEANPLGALPHLQTSTCKRMLNHGYEEEGEGEEGCEEVVRNTFGFCETCMVFRQKKAARRKSGRFAVIRFGAMWRGSWAFRILPTSPRYTDLFSRRAVGCSMSAGMTAAQHHPNTTVPSSHSTVRDRQPIRPALKAAE